MRFAALWLVLALFQDSTHKAKTAALKLDDAEGPLKGYSAPETEFEFTLTPGMEDKKFKTYSAKFPSAVTTEVESNNTVPATIWVPPSDKPVAGLVLVHFIGGNHQILETVGAALARNGIASLFFKLPYYGERNGGRGHRGIQRAASAADLRSFLRQSIQDVRRARDVLKNIPGVDPERIGVLGISLGALIAASVSGIDPTFSPVILVVGGGDLAKIVFTKSKETAFIVEKLEKEGMDEAKTREFFNEVDPLSFASRIPADRVLMFNMRHDEVIPKEASDALADKIGKPRRVWYDGKHTWVGIYVMAIVDEVKAFINR